MTQEKEKEVNDEAQIEEIAKGLPEFGRFGKELETIGILPIPNKMRNFSATKLFIFWAMASASATTPLIGYLLYDMGLKWAIVAMFLGLALGIVPTWLFSEMGRQVPLTALVVARKTFGYGTAQALSVLYTVINVGWFALNNAVGAEILSSITHSSIFAWYIIMGVIQILLVLFGAKWLEYFYRFTSPILVASYAVLTYYLVTTYHVNWGALLSNSPNPFTLNWGNAIGLVLAFGMLSWAYKTTTTSRFGKPYDGFSWSYGLATPLGIFLPILLMGILGYAGQYYANNWNIAALNYGVAPIWVVAASLGASLAIIHTNAMNLYPSTIDLLVAVDPLIRNKAGLRARLMQPLTTLILGIAAVLTSIFILSYVNDFLNIVGDAIFPLTFILLFDWYLRLRGNVGIKEFYEVPKSVGGHLKLDAVVSFIIGIALIYLLPEAAPAVFNYVPALYVGPLIGALIYLALMKIHK